MLANLDIVLCKTSHPGNIGAAARAMKNMGLFNLKLVSPKHFPHKEAIDRASGADDILNQAKAYSTLNEALSDCQRIYGTSARNRRFPWPQMTCRESVPGLMQYLKQNEKVAIVFGCEQSGLSNDELALCDYHLVIPSNPDYSSLNLGAAVQIIAYELYQASLDNLNEPYCASSDDIALKATQLEVQGLIEHMTLTFEKLQFMDPHHPQKLIPRLKRLFAKAQLEVDEVNILRGFCRAILNKI